MSSLGALLIDALIEDWSMIFDSSKLFIGLSFLCLPTGSREGVMLLIKKACCLLIKEIVLWASGVV